MTLLDFFVGAYVYAAAGALVGMVSCLALPDLDAQRRLAVSAFWPVTLPAYLLHGLWRLWKEGGA